LCFNCRFIHRTPSAVWASHPTVDDAPGHHRCGQRSSPAIPTVPLRSDNHPSVPSHDSLRSSFFQFSLTGQRIQ
jgi:hypothetical protein